MTDEALNLRRDWRSILLETPLTGKLIIYIELAYLLVVFFLVNSLGAPYAAIYALDVMNLFALIAALGKVKRTFSAVHYRTVLVLFIVFCVFLVLGDLLNLVSPMLVIWGIRNTFRFFIFFVTCVVLLDLRDVDRIMGMFTVFQVVNLFVSLFQFFALGLRQDTLGGIFGSAVGANGYSNVFFCILLTYYSLQCLAGKKPMRFFVFIAISTLVLAAMAELKFFFFEFPIIVLVAAFLYIKKVRAVVVAVLAIGALFTGLQIFASIFPNAYETVINFDKMFSYSSSRMAGGYELSRFGAFGEINGLIFNDDLPKILLGVGFGGAESSSNIAMFNSAFSQVWGYLNYRWFSHQMWYIETGAVGFSLFVGLFVSHAIYSGRLMRVHPGHRVLLQFVVLFTLVTIVNLWYNSTIRVEAAYMTFFALSISCIVAKDDVGACGKEVQFSEL